MRPFGRFTLRCLSLGMGLALGLGDVRSQSEIPRLMGISSCASATCHGGIAGSEASWRTSFSVWEACDPHAGAGLVLANDQSRAIISLLEPTSATSRAAMLDALQRRCISCHATSESNPVTSDTGMLDVETSAAQTSSTSTDPQSDTQQQVRSAVTGVSCESCHGAASEWLELHTRAGWKQNSTRFTAAIGMLNTEDVLARVDVCVRCHVGSRTADGLVRDMNHDLIAAGHPALNFDMGEFMQKLPPHWDSETLAKRESDSTPEQRNSAARWRVAASLAKLSQQRLDAHSQNPAIPFPELSEYDCTSCHHELASTALYPANYVSTWGWNRTFVVGLLQERELKPLDLASLLRATNMQVIREELGRNRTEWEDKSAAILGASSSDPSQTESVLGNHHE